MPIREQIKLICHCDAAWNSNYPCSVNTPAINDRVMLEKWLNENGWFKLEFNKLPGNPNHEIRYICPAHRTALRGILI